MVMCIYLILCLLFACVCTSSSKLIFWQITDIHFDQLYNIHGDPYAMCHIDYLSDRKVAAGKSNHLHGSSSHHYRFNLSIYGNYVCDSPWILVESAILNMAKIYSHPDFILWSGDSSPHWNSDPEFDYVYAVMRNVTDLLIRAFPNVTIIPLLGNHDSYPSSQFPGESHEFYSKYITDAGWSKLIDKKSSQLFSKTGYYSVNITSNLKVLVLNTNIYNVYNSIDLMIEDPGAQFKWLEEQFKLAKEHKYKVIITAHICPGVFERERDASLMHDIYNDRLMDIYDAYAQVTVAHICGHTHTDSFRLGNVVSEYDVSLLDKINYTADMSDNSRHWVGFVAPSVTPWVPGAATNPSVRLYTMSNDWLLDYTQYILNLSQFQTLPNIRLPLTPAPAHFLSSQSPPNTSTPAWQPLYSARDEYSLLDLSPASLVSLFFRLRSNATLFARHYLLNTGAHMVTTAPTCTGDCRLVHLCAVVCLRSLTMQDCVGRSITPHSNAVAVLGASVLCGGLIVIICTVMSIYKSSSSFHVVALNNDYTRLH